MLVVLLFAAPARADAGGPILLLVNLYLFTVGQVWIISSEFVYLKLLHKSVPSGQVFRTVVGMNVVSTLLGALLLPFLLGILGVAGMLIMYHSDRIMPGGILFAVGTWIGGDNSPYPGVALTSSIIGFATTYFITVYIERAYLTRRSRATGFPFTSLRHSYWLNALSYAGLIALFLWSNGGRLW